MKVPKKDIIASLICGEITSWFLIFVIKNPYIEELKSLSQIENLIWLLPVISPLIFLVGVLVGNFLSEIWQVFKQIVRFGEVGVLNTFIDFGILNLLISLSGITSGILLAPLNTVSFLTAVTNSYYWNKFWTFEKKSKIKGQEFFQFLLISGIGWGINTGIVVLGTTFIVPGFTISAGAGVNVMKILAALVSTTWNFLGYKFIVFKK